MRTWSASKEAQIEARGFLAACVPAFAQWLNYPTPGIPRLPNGKPNLEAPAPKTAHGRPDLSGLYDVDNGRLFQDIAAYIRPEDLPIQRAAALAKQREQDMRKDDPYSHCLPPGVPRINSGNRPFKILQTPGLIAILYETGGPNCSVAACTCRSFPETSGQTSTPPGP